MSLTDFTGYRITLSVPGTLKKYYVGDYVLPVWSHYMVREEMKCSGRVVDCWSAGRAIDRPPGTCIITKFISLAQVVPGHYSLTSAEFLSKTPFIYVCVYLCVCVRAYVPKLTPWSGNVTLYATPNPFLLNKICLNLSYLSQRTISSRALTQSNSSLGGSSL